MTTDSEVSVWIFSSSCWSNVDMLRSNVSTIDKNENGANTKMVVKVLMFLTC